MKHPFIKSALVLSAALALLNCGDETTTSTMPNIPSNGEVTNTPSPNSPIVNPGATGGTIAVSEPCWTLAADQTYIITTKLEVFDANGVMVGLYDPSTLVVSDLTGAPMVTGVDVNTLPMLQPAGTTGGNSSPAAGLSSAVVLPTSSATVTTPVVTPKSSSSAGGATTPKSSSSVGGTTPKSSSSQQQQGSDGTCFDKASNKNVKPYDNLQGKNGESYAYKEDCTINCYYDPANKNCASIGATTGGNTQPASSSSVAKSSSSVAKSSSSQGGTTTGGGTISSSYTIKYVSGGKSGSGWATRYWDCCKPHCAWPGKGGIQAHACDAQGNKISDDGAKSMCDGGNAGICRGQFPIVVNDNMAFAFAAVPGSAGAQCGKCYDLAFTGKGKYATDNHKALAGKHLIVIASNIGYDVADGQFDIMIPGGGVGIFDGCSSKMGWGSQGARYGGLLTECEESSGYKASTYKSCLTDKCNKSFANDPEAKQGCLFLANWMNAAGNPLHEYKEVECPKELLDKF